MREGEDEVWSSRMNPGLPTAVAMEMQAGGRHGLENERKADAGSCSAAPGRIPADHGGPRYYGAVVGSLNTEQQILSRFRPIAPRPSDPTCSSTLSFEKANNPNPTISVSSPADAAPPTVSIGTGGKRNRKRSGSDPPGFATPRSKRGGSSRSVARVDHSKQQQQQRGGGRMAMEQSAVIGGIEKAVEQFAPDTPGPGLQRLQHPASLVSPFGQWKEQPQGAFSNYYSTELARRDRLPSLPPSARCPSFPPPPGPGSVFHHNMYGWSSRPVGGVWQRVQSSAETSTFPSSDDGPSRGGDLASSPRQGFGYRQQHNGVVHSQGAKRGQSQQPSSHYFYGDGHAHQPAVAQDSNVGVGPVVGRDDSSARGGDSPQAAFGYRQQQNGVMHMQGVNRGPPQQPSSQSCCGDGHAHQSAGAAQESTVGGGDERQQPQQQGVDEERPQVRTLQLLPDTPSQVCNSGETSEPRISSETPYLSLGMEHSWHADSSKEKNSQESPKLSLSSRSGLETGHSQDWPSSSEKTPESLEQRSLLVTVGRPVNSTPAVKTSDYMEHAYSTADPLMLTDKDNQEIVWTNQAYERAKSEQDRNTKNSGKDQDRAGPYLDPLGTPNAWQCFKYQRPGGLTINAILWSFLNTFMRVETNRVDDISMEGEDNGRRGHIARPQALKPDGSTYNSLMLSLSGP